MFNCILFYGNNRSHPGFKTAGPFRIATELRSNGYEVFCIDLTAFDGLELSLKMILKKLINDNTLWVGFSTTFLSNLLGVPSVIDRDKIRKLKKTKDIYEDLNAFKDYVHGLNPNIKFITGGSKYFPVEDQGFQIFQSYSDKTIVEYTDLCKKEIQSDSIYSLPIIQGREFKNFVNSQIIYNVSDMIKPGDVLPIEISRGCIFKCKFCNFPYNGKKKGEWIKHTNILREEITRNYEMFGVTEYIFADDTYNDSVEKIKLMYDEVFSKLNFKIEFTTYLRLDLMMRYTESAEILKQSGLKSALFGIETINPNCAKAIGKGVPPDEQFDYIRQLKENEFSDILTNSGFIAGLPFDTEESLLLLEDFLFSDKNKLDHCRINSLEIRSLNSYGVDYSEFDLENQKYGYELCESVDLVTPNEKLQHASHSSLTQSKWKNNNTGLTSDWCKDFSDRVNNRIFGSTRFKYGGFYYSHYKTLGIPGNELSSLPVVDIQKKYDITALIKSSREMYKTDLYNFIKYRKK